MTVSAAKARCLHCDLPLGDFDDGSFCCAGCRAVYDLLHAEGLTDYYRLRAGSGVPPAPRKPDALTWIEPLLAALPEAPPGGVHTLKLDLQGIHCAACVWLLEKTFKRRPWAVDIRINPALGTVEVSWRPEGDIREWMREVERFGYAFGPGRKRAGGGSRGLLVRLAVTAAAASQVMMITLGFYTGLAPGDGAVYTVLGWTAWLLATVAVLAGGPVFFRGAYRGLRSRLAHLDLPISAGILLAYAGSTLAFLRYGPEQAYFDSLVVFVTLMLTGRWLQNRILERNRNALLSDTGAEGLVTRRLQGETVEAVPASRVSRGDVLWLVPGEPAPVDGLLMDPHGRISLDWINGESEPLELLQGGRLPAGAFNASDHPLRVEAQEDFQASRLHDLLTSRGDAAPDPSARWWDRLARWYVALVFGAAAAAFLVWLPAGLDRALQVTVAVLVVTCPCAVGLALPLAQEMTLHGLRRRGLFVRHPAFLDKALRINKVVFDKTGTLTFGTLRLDKKSSGAMGTLSAAERGTLASMTASSNHPVSRALYRASAGKAVHAPAGVHEHPGGGLSWKPNGCEYRLGSPRFALGFGGSSQGTIFARDGVALQEFNLVEDLKQDAAFEVAALTRRGLEVYLLSGDREAKVRAAATALGIPETRAVWEQSPADKAAWVERLDERDTLMVGDGINDSPVFHAAYASATPAVDRPSLPAKADFYFTGDRIAGVRRALSAARRLRDVVRTNLVLAVLYNAVALALCFAGQITPLLAAVLMPLSSLGIVVLTMFRLNDRSAVWKL